MDKSQFAIRSLYGIGALAVFVICFPFLLYFLVHIANLGGDCEGVAGACGALAAIIGLVVAPLGVLIISVFLLRVFHKRLCWLGIGRGWTVVAILWFIGSSSFLISAGNFWGASFSMGILVVQLPYLLAFFLGFVIFLCFVDYVPAKSTDQVERTAWSIVLIATGYALLISASSILNGNPVLGLLTPNALRYAVNSLSHFSTLGLPRLPLLLVSFAIYSGALTLIIVRQKKNGSRPTAPTTHSDQPLSTKARTKGFGKRKAI